MRVQHRCAIAKSQATPGPTGILLTVYVAGQNSAVGSNAEALRAFIASGGAAIVAFECNSWGDSASRPLISHPGNVFLRPMVRLWLTSIFSAMSDDVLA